jgi:hypothetical protein
MIKEKHGIIVEKACIYWTSEIDKEFALTQIDINKNDLKNIEYDLDLNFKQ